MVPEIVRLERPGVCGCGELVAAGERAGYAAPHESIVCLACLADLSSRTVSGDTSDAVPDDSPTGETADPSGTAPRDAVGATVDASDTSPDEPAPGGDLAATDRTTREAAVAATLSALRAGSAMTDASASGLLHVPAEWSAPAPASSTAASAPLIAPAAGLASVPAPETSGVLTALAEPPAPGGSPGTDDAAQPVEAAEADESARRVADQEAALGKTSTQPETQAETQPETQPMVTSDPSVVVVSADLAVSVTMSDKGQAPTRPSRHGAATLEDERMPALAHRRRASLFTRLMTVRSMRLGGQSFAAGKPDAAVAALLDAAVARGVLALHDRHIPGRRGRIEHIAVGAAGVYVIDVKHFKNASIELRHTDDAPADDDDLVVGGRVMTAALVANRARVSQLRSLLTDFGLDDVPVTGALCFVDGLLPLAVGDLEVGGVHVLRPSGLTALVAAGGAIEVDDREKLQQFLAHHLPACA